MALSVQLRVVRKPVLDGATDDCIRVNLPVGLGYYLAVYAARLVVTRGPVVLNSPGHHFNLLLREPSPEVQVRAHDASRLKMVSFPVNLKPRVVVGGNRENHIFIDVIVPGKFKALLYDINDVVAAVRSVKGVVAGNNVLFDVFSHFRISPAKVATILNTLLFSVSLFHTKRKDYVRT